jgi:hypothetical protein
MNVKYAERKVKIWGCSLLFIENWGASGSAGTVGEKSTII